MSPVVLTIVIVLAVVFAAAAWMDFKRRRLGDTKSGAVMSKETRALRRDDKGKGARWGAGGGG